MMRAFAHFDTDNSGYITEDELEAALRVRSRVYKTHKAILVGCLHESWKVVLRVPLQALHVLLTALNV